MNAGRMLLTLCLLLSPSVAHAAPDTYYIHDFPEPDRVEIIATQSPAKTDGPKVNLGATDARKVAALLRAQTLFGPKANCDRIQYILRFYSGKKLIAEDGICLHCGCFLPLNSDLHATADPISFDSASAEAKSLAAYLEKLFPDPIR